MKAITPKEIREIITVKLGISIWNLTDDGKGFEVQMDKQTDEMYNKIVDEFNQYTYAEFVDNYILYVYK
jgi:hypothetical protein